MSPQPGDESGTGSGAEPAERPVRRTQAERRATTRTALLQATVAGLVEHGYASLTTAQIAEEAGVTRGALAHHFASKSELVVDAVTHLGVQLGEEFTRDVARALRRAGGKVSTEHIGFMLDEVWKIYSSPAFVAVLELWVAARTDAELGESLRAFEAEGNALVTSAAEAAIGDAARVRGFAALVGTSLNTMRGLSLAAAVKADVQAEWKVARRHLIILWEDLLAG